VQCGWEMSNSWTIIEHFQSKNVPLTAGVITGQGNCYYSQLLAYYRQGHGLLEIASHSVTHRYMPNLTYSEQLVEVKNSKNALEVLLGAGTIRTFFVPYNAWNYNTATALRNSGYDIVSAQCSASELIVPSFDYMCAANMYRNRPSFFSSN